jgi:hypothetical protein
MSLNCSKKTDLFISQMIHERGGLGYNDINREKTEELRQKPVSVPLYPPQFPYALARV